MPSFWPWKAGGTDAAAFEKTLSQIATRIAKATALNDSLRQRSRRVKTIVTLWGGFAYILIAVISVLVTGWKNWGPVEWSVVSGGPVLLYAIRRAFTAYYDYRISKTQAWLNSLQKERDATIAKLKEATKYNSTQALLEKYGEKPPPKRSSSRGDGQRKPEKPRGPQPGRTNLPPPPTANIPRAHAQQPMPQPPSQPTSPIRPNQQFPPPRGPMPPQMSQALMPTEEFAPNAFTTPPQYAPAPSGRPGWLDKLMDAVMGEDETLPKNRFALICQHCRLVNGQAPPGTLTLEDLGQWRCAGCGGWNGEESETRKLVKEIEKQVEVEPASPTSPTSVSAGEEFVKEEDGSAEVEGTSDEDALTPEEDDAPPAQSTRSKSKGKK